MKNWFLQLSSRQSTNVYIITIFVSGLSFLFIPLTGISFVIWLATLVLIVKETKLIKQKKYESNENNSKKCACNDSSISSADVPELYKTNTVPESEEAVEQTTTSPVFNVIIKPKYVEGETAGELGHLDFGKPAGMLGRFLSYEPHTLSRPTEGQLSRLKDLGVYIPENIKNDITVEDASDMIRRAEYDKEAPSPELVALATGLKLNFSAFTGNRRLFHKIVYTDNHRDRAALYAYAVHQSMCGYSFGNMLENPNCPEFYAFADQVLAEPALMRSLLDRTSDDYKKPYRGTAIYKAAAAFLTTMSK